MPEVTQILAAAEAGDPKAAAELLPLVYDELRKLAAARLADEKPGQTLQATALVHEAYLRLVGKDQSAHPWNGRGHFFAAAAEAMRRILVDNARRRSAGKRWAGQRISLDEVEIAVPERPDDLIDLDQALIALEKTDRTAAELVKLRYFAGLTLREAAAALDLAPRSADAIWAYARAWLLDRLKDSDPKS